MVRAKSLTPDALLTAMSDGNFYTSTGVILEEVAFKRSSRTLHISVQAAPGVTYRIHFITTKRGFDPTVRTVECPPEKDRTARKIPVYSEDIGRTVKVVEGTEGTYQMASDDLYIRAKIESNIPSGYECYFHPATQVAWTQPHA